MSPKRTADERRDDGATRVVEEQPVHQQIFSPIRVSQLHTEVLTQLKALIDDGVLAPGQTLPSERDLSQQLGVSRNSLREALRVLEARGVIVARHGVGRTVRDTSATSSETGSLSGAMETSTLLEVFEVRSALEAVAVSLACARATAEDLVEIRAASHPASDNWDDTAAFHIAIARASHNYVLEHIVTDLMQLAGAIRQRDRYSSPATEALISEHAEITQAIEDRDPNRAIDMMRQHLNESRQRVEGD